MARKRPKMPPKLRTLVYIRDGWACKECGWRVPEDEIARYDGSNIPRVLVRVERVLYGPMRYQYPKVRPVYRELQVDHITPLIHGGAFADPDNLQSLCNTCNYRKGVRL